jgi:hypothetical protein
MSLRASLAALAPFAPPPFAALALSACGGQPIDKPKAPDMTALVAAYETPEGTFDEATVAALTAELLERAPIVQRLGFDVSIAGVVDQAVDESDDPSKETTSVPGSGSEVAADEGGSLLQGNGYLVITRICDGWSSPAVAAQENGAMALNAGFTEDGLDPVVWGTLTECKYLFDGTQVTVGGRGNDDDGDVRLHLAEKDLLSHPLLFDLDAEVTLGSDPPREVDFDFRILPGEGFELRLPATNGHVVVQVADGQLGTIRADNGDFTCDLSAATCTNEAGEVVKL